MNAQTTTHRFTHVGKGGELFLIFIVNLLLTILTLGVYSFWAKARVRRYLWTQTRFDDEPLEYTGTGLELFLGWLLAMVLLALGVIGLAVIGGLLAQVNENLVFVPFLIGYVGFFVLIGVAIHRAVRYRLSRTRWRGIRLGLGGSSLKYAGLMIGYGLLAAFTLGLAMPWMRNRLYGYLAGHSSFGSAGASYDGRGRELLRPFLLVWGLGVAGMAGYAAYMASIYMSYAAQAHAQGGAPTAPPEAAAAPLIMLLCWVPAGLAWLWYRAREIRYFAGHTHLQQASFASDVRARGFLLLMLGNLALLVFTLGLAFPWVVTRSMRFLSAHLTLEGELDLAAIAQSEQRVPGTGEGLFEAFDLGAV